jgi:chromosome segregation ATPase
MRNWFSLLTGIALAAAGWWNDSLFTAPPVNWIYLLILLAGGLIGLGLRGLIDDRDERRRLEESQQALQRAQQLLAERAGRVSAVEAQLNEMQAKYDTARRSLAQATQELDSQGQRVTELVPLAACLSDREERLRSLQAEALLARASQEQQRLELEEALQQRELAETRMLAQQSRHNEKLGLLGQRLREMEALERAAQSRDSATAKMLARVAELEPQARMATDWQVRHDILQRRLTDIEGERDRLRQHQSELESRIEQLLALDSTAKLQNPEPFREQLNAREKRIRELEIHLTLLRQRVLELEPLHGELQRREQQLQELQSQLQRKSTQRDDDLTLVNGIGPQLASFLLGRGVHSFQQVANWTEEDIDQWEQLLPQFKGRIRREGWVQSARLEHIRKYGDQP